jgi:hypothetical protein
MDTGKSPTRRLRIFLRDFRMVEAVMNLADGQSLTSYFAHRRSYMNLSQAQWAGGGDRVEHAVLRVQQVLWAAAADGDVPLSSASLAGRGRDVEIQLDGGLLVRGTMLMSEQQRLSDYLEIAGPFVPLQRAQLLRSGRPPKEVNVTLGDIVLNQDAIQATWQLDQQTADQESPAAAQEEAAGDTDTAELGDGLPAPD